MEPHELDGKRIKLIYIDDKYTKLKAGDMGTVTHVDGIGQIHMRWDSGSTLALIPEIDKYQVIEDEPISENRVSKSRSKMMMFESFNLRNSMDTLEAGMVGIKRLVNSASFVGMEFEPAQDLLSARLDISFVDGDNTQGIIYEIDLDDNMIVRLTYLRSDRQGDIDTEEPIETHFIDVHEMVDYLKTEVENFIKVEESKRHKKGKRV